MEVDKSQHATLEGSTTGLIHLTHSTASVINNISALIWVKSLPVSVFCSSTCISSVLQKYCSFRYSDHCLSQYCYTAMPHFTFFIDTCRLKMSPILHLMKTTWCSLFLTFSWVAQRPQPPLCAGLCSICWFILTSKVSCRHKHRYDSSRTIFCYTFFSFFFG